MTTQAKPVIDVSETSCCVVGGGPAGAVLSLLLARKGIPVTLLESHRDFDRDFRGDTVHPSVLEALDQIDLAERLLQLPHSRLETIRLQGSSGFTLDLQSLETKFPFVMVLPQVRFLEFIVEEARQYPAFRLVMGARVEELVVEDGEVRGVRYESEDGVHEVRARLTVGADGRFSKVRLLAGIEPIRTSSPMDVLWFRLPRKEGDPHGLNASAGGGRVLVLLERPADWQVGYVIQKGGYQQLRAEGLESLRRGMAELLPWLADRVHHLKSWKQISLLSVESSRVRRWYEPGLLLIGDAAHVMSPVGGVGINYAIMDAVEAYNLLSGPLARGRVTVEDLARVQKKRELPTRVVQAIQRFAQNRVIGVALKSEGTFQPPFFVRWGPLRKRVARLMTFGISPARIEV